MLLHEIGLIFTVLVCLGTSNQSSIPEILSVSLLTPTSVRINWNISLSNIEKYDIMYKPTEASYKVVAVVAANSNVVTINNLMPDTQYQMSITALKAGRKYRSRSVVFRTLNNGVVIADGNIGGVNNTSSGSLIDFEISDIVAGIENQHPPTTTPIPPPPYGENTFNTSPFSQIRGIEITIVLLVLLLWLGAIALFFNRWGKIRMLIPYQPDYKETQLKVPGTGACSSVNACQSSSSSSYCCPQRRAHNSFRHDRIRRQQSESAANTRRPRVQSSSSMGRQGIQIHRKSSPVRKTRSVDYIPLSQQRQEYRNKLPTFSISIASDESDDAVGEQAV